MVDAINRAKPTGAKGSDAVTPQHSSAPAGSIRTKADLKNTAQKVAYIKEHGREAFEALPLGSA